MREIALRLKRGDDLRICIQEACKSIDTAVVLSGVGCVYKIRIRLAKAVEYMEKEENYEIVSLTGTISKGQAHIHISLSDEHGNTIGGHLEEGCIIDTTCELVLAVLQEYSSSREFDLETGYDEINFTKIR